MGIDNLAIGIKNETQQNRQGNNKDREDKQAPYFPGTIIPIEYLFLYFSQGKSYREFLDIYKDVKEEDVLTVIEAAQTVLCRDDFRVLQELIALRSELQKLSRNTGAAFEQLAEIVQERVEESERKK